MNNQFAYNVETARKLLGDGVCDPEEDCRIIEKDISAKKLAILDMSSVNSNLKKHLAEGRWKFLGGG